MRFPLTRTYNTELLIKIVPLSLFPLYLVWLVPPVASTVSLCVFYFCRLIGKLTAFLQLQAFSFRNPTSSTSVERMRD
jgi:hypothetical protein